MKLFLVLLFSFFAANAKLHDPKLFNESDYSFLEYSLSCEYEYVTETTPKVGRFHSFGTKGFDGKRRFRAKVTSIPSYYFEVRHDIPYGVWHNNAAIEFEAALEDNYLTYSFSYKNYKRDRSKLSLLFSEKREVFVGDLQTHGFSSFDYLNGRVLNRDVDSEPWINAKGVVLKGCVIEHIGGDSKTPLRELSPYLDFSAGPVTGL